MTSTPKKAFLEKNGIFKELHFPEEIEQLAGYAALMNIYDLKLPLPRLLYGIGKGQKVINKKGWCILPSRTLVAQSLEGHLSFALKHEGLDLVILKRLFLVVEPSEIKALVLKKPTGSYTRRIWFLFEWLTGIVLDLPNAKTGAYVDVVNAKQQYAGMGINSTRHRVKNNLLGTPDFCPMVSKTQKLEAYESMDLAGQAAKITGAVSKNLMARTAAFLLLKDSKSSFTIEGEQASQDRISRWGRVIGEAGQHSVTIEELKRLQSIVIGDARFVKKGLRQEGGFVGTHDRETGMPYADHISARHEDLLSLLEGMMSFSGNGEGGTEQLDAVIMAAIIAFGFVYMHPFQDGNGRLHRYLIHHILALYQFTPPNITFPISSAILEDIESYRAVLESYSKRLLPCIQWEATSEKNVAVLNDTADFYRFFDATRHAEFLYGCVQKVLTEDLPQEIAFLQNYDQFSRAIDGMIDMPAKQIDLLFRFLKQNNGVLSGRALKNEFSALKPQEVQEIERFYQQSFGED